MELEPLVAKKLPELLREGESPVLEYKASLRWDFRTQQVNTELQKVVARTVAGFMNFEGGTLLIGVTDDGNVVGIENDLKTLKRRSRDEFEQVLRSVLSDYLGTEFSQYVRVSFEEEPSGTVARAEVEPSSKPVYLNGKAGKEFYVRAGNTTRPLDVQATHDYISMHWES